MVVFSDELRARYEPQPVVGHKQTVSRGIVSYRYEQAHINKLETIVSIFSVHAAAFYKEVAQNGSIWTIRDNAGFPAPLNNDGKRAQPFWSSKSRAENIIRTVPAYSGFELFELELKIFLERWITGLAKDGILVGINWIGGSATGFDVEPEQVLKNILAQPRISNKAI